MEESTKESNLYQYFLIASFIVGAYRIIIFCFELVLPLFVRRLNLKKRYGGGWVIITGGSEGIGLGIAQQFAKEGFNIILVSRSIPKLEKAKEKLLSLNPCIEVEIKSINFQQTTNEDQYMDAFGQYLNKDISVLVNNVGCFLPRYFVEKSFKQYRREMNINCLPITILSRLFIQKMKNRKNRSGIINLSSLSADVVFAGASNYSATKLFGAYLSQTLAYQYKDKIDILTVKPFFVTTSMIKNMDSFANVTTQSLSRNILDSIGNRNVIFGSIKHNFQGLCIKSMHNGIVTYFSTLQFRNFRRKYDKENE